MNVSRYKLKKYIYTKIKDLEVDEKYKLLSEMNIAIEETRSELNQQNIFCENCGKHFIKSDCKEKIVEEKEFIPDEDRDDNMVVKGENMIYTILYRICPECGKDDLFDKILQTKKEK